MLLTVLAVLAPTFQGWLKQAQGLLDKQDQKEEERAKELADRARRDVLEQVRRAWVQTELHGSLYERARIELGLVERQLAVDNPLRAVLRRPDESDHLLERGQPIAEVYRQLGKQLLILGEPGVGKTTLLMELADQLLDEAEAEPDQPMPVVFHLSTWADERRPLVLWLVDELYKRYGVPRRLGQMWVDTDRVMPLLDGLDEVVAEHRDACVAAINTFHDEHGVLPLAVCSRITEYEVLQAKLRLRGAIVIQPLTRVEVDRYLRQVGRPLAAVRAAVHDDQQLAELLTTPLFLSIVALTYKGRAAATVRASGTLGERRQSVLADYITVMLRRPQPSATLPRYAPQPTVSWLAWLARAMLAHGQSVFYLDWIQPDWLPTQKQRRLVTVGSAVVAGLAAGLCIVLAIMLDWVWSRFFELRLTFDRAVELAYRPRTAQFFELQLDFGLALGLAFGLPIGLIVGLTAYHSAITPTERLRWTTTSLRRNFRRWFVLGGLAGLGMSLTFSLALLLVVKVALRSALVLDSGVGLSDALVQGLRFGVPTGLSVGLFFGLISGLRAQSYVTPPAPGKAVQSSKRSALVSGLPIGLGVGLGAWLVATLVSGLPIDIDLGLWLVFTLIYQSQTMLVIGLAAGLGVGFIVALQRGGGAYLRHHVLRGLLVRNRSIPRDYVAFLNYATQLILLRHRGGGYEFVHRMLLEHFAALEPHSWQAQVSQGVGRLAEDDSDSGSATPVRAAQAPPHPRSDTSS